MKSREEGKEDFYLSEELSIDTLREEWRKYKALRKRYATSIETSFYVAMVMFLGLFVGVIFVIRLYFIPILVAEYPGFLTLFASPTFSFFLQFWMLAGGILFAMAILALKQHKRSKRKTWRVNRWNSAS